MNPFRSILQLSVGDFLAKSLNFAAFVYLARVLGVDGYGVLEFAVSLITYFLLVADAGLEMWAIREAARGEDVRRLTARVVPLRLLMALASFIALLALLPAFPNYPYLRVVLVLFGLTLFTQAASLKWVFMGQEKMARVAWGLVLAQVVFAVALFAGVRDPSDVALVPALRLAGDGAMLIYFLHLFSRRHGGLRLAPTLRGAGSILRPAVTMGASHGLGLINYNFDSVLLGFFLGSTAVGLYGAAYKPVTVMLAMPLTYFLGLFPSLARTYADDRRSFHQIVTRSFRLTSVFAIPIGVGGTFLAGPVINLLFGSTYSESVSVLQILCWSGTLVILRGTYRQALNAAGRSDLDLRCAGISAGLNIVLNLILIPRYGIVGAAAATVAAEVIWLTIARYCFHRYVIPVKLLPFLVRPSGAALLMAGCFLLVQPLTWPVQALLSALVYFGTLILLDGPEVWSWLQARRARLPISPVGN